MSTIHFSHQPLTVQDVIYRYQHGQLEPNPGFQRDSVWQDRDRSKLIDSILRNYPLPSIFFYKKQQDDGKTVYWVIDGKQRIESILLFTGMMRGNRFSVLTKLSGYEQEERLDWAALKRRKKHDLLLEYKLQTIEVSGDLSDIIVLFIRINSLGKALTKAEIRNARFYESEFLKKASRIATDYSEYFKTTGILSASQISRMKHIELVCELMVSADQEDIINKKRAIDAAIGSKDITTKRLEKMVKETKGGLNRLMKMFPNLKQTRFKQKSDFYSLAVLVQKFEREGLILTDRKKNDLAWDLLKAFSTGVDQVSQLQKQAKGVSPDQEMFREYLLTVREGTDEIRHRRKREQILRGLLESLFEQKDSQRLFSPEQRRILWNSSDQRKCTAKGCGKILTWDDFTIDHVNPYSKGGRTALDNAALMCREHNSAQGNRMKFTVRKRRA